MPTIMPIVYLPEPVRGFSHIQDDKPCQDASLLIRGRRHTFIAISDGHGGNPYFRSDLGSRFAVAAAGECMTDTNVISALRMSKKSTEKERNQVILQLKKSILCRWNALVHEHMENNPFTESDYNGIEQRYAERYRAGEYAEQAYGATLIAVLRTASFVLVLQIGDGSCVIADKDGVFSRPVPEDERCFLNATTSICDDDVIDADKCRHYYSGSLPAAIMIGSDGIDDSYVTHERINEFYKAVLNLFVQKGEKTAKKEIAQYLPELTEKGSRDDISIGVIIEREGGRLDENEMMCYDGDEKVK